MDFLYLFARKLNKFLLWTDILTTSIRIHNNKKQKYLDILKEQVKFISIQDFYM